MITKLFGARVRELRDSKLISQKELSVISGIDRSQISKIEQGKLNVTLETIKKIADSFDISISQLMNISEEVKPHPFVKWAGGKTQVMSKLKDYMPSHYNDYYEPFVGGGALLFELLPKNAHINDQNNELISAYNCFKNDSDFNKLKLQLKIHESNHSEDYFYSVRSEDKEDNYSDYPLYKTAARMIYLNKSCFNGLYRVNSKGFFNVPSAKKDKVVTFDPDNFRAIKKYFSLNNITITNKDYSDSLSDVKKDDFVYLDPPFDPFPDKSGFVDYGKDGFDSNEQKRLKKEVDRLNSIGAYVMISNHNTPFINDLYSGYNIHVINAKRMINSKGANRGNVEEVIITNY